MNTKRLSDRIGERVRENRLINRARFLALRSEIQEALNDGWSMSAIHSTLLDEGKIAFCYSSFVNYARKLGLRSPLPVENVVVVEDEKNAVPVTQVVTQKVEAKKPEVKSTIRGFDFNPKPNKEDLV